MTRRRSIAEIQARVALAHGLKVEALLAPGKQRDNVTHARDVALWCASAMTLHSHVSIGEHFGGLNSTLVDDGVRRVKARMAETPSFRREVRRLVHTIDPIHRHKEYAR